VHKATRGDLTAIGALVLHSRKTSSVVARDSIVEREVVRMSWGGHHLFFARGKCHRDRGQPEVAMGVERDNSV